MYIIKNLLYCFPLGVILFNLLFQYQLEGWGPILQNSLISQGLLSILTSYICLYLKKYLSKNKII
jgi:hypothetical protein